MNAPVGEPPKPIEQPKTLEEYIMTARRAAAGRTDLAHLWAMLAQVEALKLVAQRLDDFNEFIGVYDEVDPDDADEGEKAPEPRFADTLAEGILGAVAVVKDDIMAHPLVQMAMATAQAEAMKHMKPDGVTPPPES